MVTSWPLQSSIGSGVAVVAESIEKAIGRSDIKTEFYSPQNEFSGGYLSQSYRRILFDLQTSGKIGKAGSGAPVITFDFDGFAMPRGVRFASVIGGIMGDIVRFERGYIATVLRLMAKLEKRACQNAEVVFVPSLYTRDKVVSLYGVEQAKVKVMHNGIFFDEWTTLVDKAEKVDGRPLTVLCVARLYRRKGIDSLISAWSDVVAKNRKAVLRIVGDGLEGKSLRKLAAKNRLPESIIFEGDVRSRSEMARLYANADIFCLPSLHETFGLVYLEAMAAGLPVVALNSTAVPEVVRDGIDGILIEPGDTENLAKTISNLLDDTETRNRMGSEAKTRVRENFDWYTVLKPLTEWLEV